MQSHFEVLGVKAPICDFWKDTIQSKTPTKKILDSQAGLIRRREIR